MIKTVIRVMMTAAAATMVVAPIAAQANTRASDAGSVYRVGASKPGVGRAAKGESVSGGVTIVLALLAAAAAVGAIVVASDSDDDGQSPGT